MTNVLVVGVTARQSAGKDSAFEAEAQSRGYEVINFSQPLKDELGEANANRTTMTNLSRQWRVESGDEGIIARKMIALVQAKISQEGKQKFLLLGIRNPAEIKLLNETFSKSFYLSGLFASARNRREWWIKRDLERQLKFNQISPEIIQKWQAGRLTPTEEQIYIQPLRERFAESEKIENHAPGYKESGQNLWDTINMMPKDFQLYNIHDLAYAQARAKEILDLIEGRFVADIEAPRLFLENQRTHSRWLDRPASHKER